MKTNQFLSAIFFFAISISVLGQEQQKKIKRISIRDLYIQTGGLSERATPGTVEDFRRLAPQSALLSNDLTGYSSVNPYMKEYPSPGTGMASSGMFSALVGIQFSDKEKTAYHQNPQLRIGISYYSGKNLQCNLYKEEKVPYDTLISTQTGEPVYLDSMYLKEYGMEYASDQLRMDGSFIYRTNPEARLSLFSGIGFSAGASIHAATEIYYDKSGEIQAIDSNGDNVDYYYYGSGYYSFGHDKTERHENEMNYSFSAYMPMGIDLRLGKKREFWKRTHLFFELRPGINSTTIPELSSFTNASIQYGFGVKIACD